MATVNPGDDGTATSTTHAATINHTGGVITTEALTTAQNAEYTMNVTDNNISASSIVIASVRNGTNSHVPIYISEVTPGAGTCNINVVAGSTLNGTIIISYVVF